MTREFLLLQQVTSLQLLDHHRLLFTDSVHHTSAIHRLSHTCKSIISLKWLATSHTQGEHGWPYHMKFISGSSVWQPQLTPRMKSFCQRTDSVYHKWAEVYNAKVIEMKYNPFIHAQFSERKTKLWAKIIFKLTFMFPFSSCEMIRLSMTSKFLPMMVIFCPPLQEWKDNNKP